MDPSTLYLNPDPGPDGLGSIEKNEKIFVKAIYFLNTQFIKTMKKDCQINKVSELRW